MRKFAKKSIDGKKHLSEGACSIWNKVKISRDNWRIQKMIGENKMIPDFLKPENIIIDPEMEKFGAAIEKYEKHFGKD